MTRLKQLPICGPVLRTGRACRAFSYVELCLSIVILTICLAPATRLLPMILANQRNLEARYELSLIAQEKLDTGALSLSRDFTASSVGGDLATEGHPDWRYELDVVVPAEGGGRYATLTAQTWIDENANARLDPGETHVRFDTIRSNENWSP